MKKPSSQFLLRQTLKEMLEVYPLRQISVNDILRESGVSKATFYKYFNNKKDLLSDIVYRDLVAGNFYDFSRSIAERKLETLEKIGRNRRFYRHVFELPFLQQNYVEHAAASTFGYYARFPDMDAERLKNTCRALAAGILETNRAFAQGELCGSPEEIALWHADLLDASALICQTPFHGLSEGTPAGGRAWVSGGERLEVQ